VSKCGRARAPVASTPVPQGGSYTGRREWTVALVAAVMLWTGACRSPDEPAASASGPNPRSTHTIDRHQYACDTWRTARSNFLDAVQRTDITLTDPDATSDEIHARAVEVGSALAALENAVIIATGNDDQNADYWLQLLAAVQITRGQVKYAGDDPQKIHAAMHKPLIAKYEDHLLDVCQLR
jgi:hypothetical protein